MLWMFQRVNYGTVSEKNADLPDLSRRAAQPARLVSTARSASMVAYCSAAMGLAKR